jgi:hypothetical protein
MLSFMNPKTAQVPSAFVMPSYGHALGKTSVCATGVGTWIVRDRQAVIGADLGITQGFAGTPAWRPPIC